MNVAAGKASVSPTPEDNKKEDEPTAITKPKTQLQPRMQSSAKRKLVGKDTEASTSTNIAGKDTGSGNGKKKMKGDKKLLSFGDDE